MLQRERGPGKAAQALTRFERERGLEYALLFCVGMLLAGCGGEPFAYQKVSGRVSYEDGSRIPVDPLVVTFYPQTQAIDEKTYPRPGTATVDRETGRFDTVTSHKYGDGLVRGRHKVTLSQPGRQQIAASLVPPECFDPERTPLEIDTADSPFELKVRKPEMNNRKE